MTYRVISSTVALVAALFLATTPARAQPALFPPPAFGQSSGVIYNQQGPYTYGSDGTTWTQMGNFTYGSNGVTCSRLGNFTYCN
jgi:hypothetical protein